MKYILANTFRECKVSLIVAIRVVFKFQNIIKGGKRFKLILPLNKELRPKDIRQQTYKHKSKNRFDVRCARLVLKTVCKTQPATTGLLHFRKTNG